MAIIALSMSTTSEVVSERDPARGTPDATVFVIGPIDLFVQGAVFDRTLEFNRRDGDDLEAVRVRMNEMSIETVRHGLRGWRNLKDATGAEIPFTTQTKVVSGRSYSVVSEELLALLPMALVRELASKITELQSVPEGTLKN